MQDERAFEDLRRITWKIIAACKIAMKDIPGETRVHLLAEVTAAEEMLGKLVTREGKRHGKRTPAGVDLRA